MYQCGMTGTKSIADISYGEQSQVVVETVTKMSKKQGDVMPKFKSEANRVECKGVGLKRAILNRQNTFNVSACNAGEFIQQCPESWLNLNICSFGRK